MNHIVAKVEGATASRHQGGEAVVNYREPLITQEMGYHRLSRRGKNITIFPFTFGYHHNVIRKNKLHYQKMLSSWFLTTVCYIFYATIW